MRRMLIALVALGCACDEPDDSNGWTPRADQTSSTPTSATATPTSTSKDPGTGGPSTALYDYDCTQPWPATSPNGAVGIFGSAEDFDLDGNGYALQLVAEDLTAKNKAGDDTFVLSPNVTSWAGGTRVLASGDVLISDISAGTVVRIDGITGAKTEVFSSLNWPNGIEVGSDGYAYVADFTLGGFIAKFDPYDPTDWEVVLDNIDYANGLILSPDEQILYIAQSLGDILAVDRNADGSWGLPRVVVEPMGSAQGINADICGNVYWTETDRILRASPDGSQVDLVAELNGGFLPNIRWGHEIGGWEVDHLYANDRFTEQIHDIAIGIPGKRHVARL